MQLELHGTDRSTAGTTSTKYKALAPNADREEAIIGLPEDKIIRNFRGEIIADYSTTEKECAAEFLPLPLVFDTVSLTNWQMKYLQVDPTRIQERLTRWSELLQVVQRYQQYQIPVILLRKETPKEAVCQVFEKVNTGGVSLNVFELLTATYAADNYNLRNDWAEREKQLKKQKVLGTLESTDFLQAITLLASRARRLQALANGSEPEKAPAISCKRKDVLKLTLDDYKSWAEPVTKGFETAARLLYTQKIFMVHDLPYRTQLTPLAAMFAILGDRSDNYGVKAKLAQWYWCGVFGELYGGSIETRFAKDLPEVLAWLDDGPEPDTITDANFPPVRLLSLRTRNSAAYKGLFTLLLRDGGLDFRTGEAIGVQMYFEHKIDIHHIFPQNWCKNNGIEPKRCDSIVNKTPLSAKTNRMIGGNAPSVYLARLQKTDTGISEERLNNILRSHLIEPDALRKDNFDLFFRTRQDALLSRIEKAMGKPIVRGSLESEEVEVIDYEQEEEAA